MSTQTEEAPDTLYAGTAGTLCHINGERGTVRGFRYAYGQANPATHAYVVLDERPVMLLVELGQRVGDRLSWAEIASAREIDRDEFDRLTGLDEMRRQMGWTL